MPEDPIGELKQTNKGRAGLFVWSHGWSSCPQAQSNFKLAGVMLLCSYGSTALSLGYANHGRSWINNWKWSLHWTLCCLSYLSGRIQGSYFKAYPNTSIQPAVAALTTATETDDHIHWSAAEVTTDVMGLLRSAPAFFSAGGHQQCHRRYPAGNYRLFTLAFNVNSLPSAA